MLCNLCNRRNHIETCLMCFHRRWSLKSLYAPPSIGLEVSTLLARSFFPVHPLCVLQSKVDKKIGLGRIIFFQPSYYSELPFVPTQYNPFRVCCCSLISHGPSSVGRLTSFDVDCVFSQVDSIEE